MTRTAANWTDAQLLEYSEEHLYYEVWMLAEANELIGGGGSSPAVQAETNAALESFAIHLRNLVDFFYPNRPRRDDVLADDFFPRRQRPASFPALTQSLDDARTRAHKQVSHLTTKRVFGADPGKMWETGRLVREMFGVLGVFVAMADNSKLHQNVGNYLTLARYSSIDESAYTMSVGSSTATVTRLRFPFEKEGS